MKKIIILIAIVIVLVVGYFVVNKESQEAPVQQPVSQPEEEKEVMVPVSMEEKIIITYTNAGYSPNSLSIKKGDTATFTNQSSKAMWPASALHPTHRAYPTTGGCLGSTFDACQGVQPGESWSFRFDIPGSWKYHDHLNPQATGVIIVE